MKRRGFASRSLIPILGLALFAVLSFGTALQESAVFDEPTHITSGFLYWKTGQYFLNPVNTPLLRLWMALPLLALPLTIPLPPPAWVIQNQLTLSDVLFNFNDYSPDRILVWARWMMLLLGLGTAWLVWRWANELFDRSTARFSLLFFVTCPPVLAYSHLATADFGAAAFSFLALYLFWRYFQKPSQARALAAGMAMGLNVTAKFTGLLLLPVLGYLSYVRGFWSLKAKARATWPAYSFLLYVIGVVLVLIVVYRGDQLWRIGQGLEDLRSVLAVENQYFLGRYSVGKRWLWYYAACFLVKTPASLLILGAGSLVLLWRERTPTNRQATLWLLIPFVLYLVIISLTSSQPGIRRVLFLYPIACLLAGFTAARAWKISPIGRVTVAALVCWTVGATLYFFPRYFAYANEWVGGPAQCHRYLVDSNSDWGQGLKQLGRFLKKEGIRTIYLAYFGGGTPQAYGIRYVWVGQPASAFLVQNQASVADVKQENRILFAISATLRAGYFGGSEEYSWLMTRRPMTQVMDSIFVYDLTGDTAALQKIAQLVTPKAT